METRFFVVFAENGGIGDKDSKMNCGGEGPFSAPHIFYKAGSGRYSVVAGKAVSLHTGASFFSIHVSLPRKLDKTRNLLSFSVVRLCSHFAKSAHNISYRNGKIIMCHIYFSIPHSTLLYTSTAPMSRGILTAAGNFYVPGRPFAFPAECHITEGVADCRTHPEYIKWTIFVKEEIRNWRAKRDGS